MDVFTYDFGYAWPWTYGHLIAAVIFGVVGWLTWRLDWPRPIPAAFSALTIWALIGMVIVHVVLRMNLPLQLPTEQFLTDGTGRVLDAGAGSGRSALMVLLARPNSRVLALDLYEGDFGISDNTPERLLANAERAGVRDRVHITVGDMRQMPFADDSLDAAVSAYAIDHLSSAGVERSLTEIERVLRPSGDFLLMVINPDIWTRVAFPFLLHHAYWGPQSNHARWRDHVTHAGFEIIEQGTTSATLYLLARKRPHHKEAEVSSLSGALSERVSGAL